MKTTKKFIFSFACLSLLVACANTTKSETKQTQETDMESTTENKNSSDVLVDIKTTMGDIEIRLFGDTPKHRDNFVKLVNDGFYNGTLFHRVINEFMVQAGDPDSKNAPAGQMLGSGDPGYTIPAEIDYPNHFHKRGALAAARTGDNVNPNRESSGSQFYIVTGKVFNDSILDIMEPRLPGGKIPEKIRQAYRTEGGTPHLDGAYTVFGEVVKGMDVVDKIQKAETDRFDRPNDDIRIISMSIVK